jgi:imidazolonepropionase-like amidohydrolase
MNLIIFYFNFELTIFNSTTNANAKRCVMLTYLKQSLKIIADKSLGFETMYKVNIFLFIALMASKVLPAQSSKIDDKIIIIKNATIIPSPDDSIIQQATIVVENGKIIYVGNESLPAEKNAVTINAAGCFVLAGFWNSHVHFIESKWAGADTISNERMEIQLQQFLTRYGFDYVFDIGSYLGNTLSIKKRIETKRVKGPYIFTTGLLFAPPGGQPVYLDFRLPELFSSTDAKKKVTNAINNGANAIKIYSGSIVTNTGKVVYMNPATIQAVSNTAHNFHKLVFAHPQTDSGVELAVQNGVDVIAHTTLHKTWSNELLNEMIAKKISLISTLKLYDFLMRQEHLPDSSVCKLMQIPSEELGRFSKMGGRVLFGTDAGYMTDYNPGDEYMYMQKAGLTFRQILATLTTAPAGRFNKSSFTGKIHIGMDADFVILSADPLENIKNLTSVLYTIKHGEIIYNQ